MAESENSTPSNLSPLAQRLSLALEHIAGSDPRLAMISRAFAKHLRKNPIADDELLAALDWVEAMVTMVRHGGDISSLPSVDDSNPNLESVINPDNALDSLSNDLAVVE